MSPAYLEKSDNQLMPKKTDSRLLTLDAMRGVAAISVVLFHLDFVGKFAPSGYLAVDFFFLMSGLVIARTYQERLKTNLSLSHFMIDRLIRLYPLYLLGLFVGLTRRIAQIATHHPESMAWPDFGISAVFNLLMLPSPVTSDLAPFNIPSWSLFLELIVNIVWATFLIRTTKSRLATYVLVLGISLCFAIAFAGSADVGWAWPTLIIGMLRSFFGFGFGVLLARSLSLNRAKDSFFAVAAIICLLIVFLTDMGPRHRVIFDLFAIFVCFPAILCLGISFNPPVVLKQIAIVLGDISYPMYMLHLGPLFSIGYLAKKLQIPPVFWIPIFIIFLCLLSIYIARTYDPRARRLIKAQIERWRSRKSAAA